MYYYHYIYVCACVLLVSSTKQSRGETSPVIKEFFSEKKNEAYGITKGSNDQSPIKITENVAYSTMEQQPSLNTPPVNIYETIN